MGQKNTALKVNAGLRLQGDCGSVDGVRLSCRKVSCCCGRKKRLLAAFSFPGKDEEAGPRAAAKVATVKVGRLMKKDGETPVMVTCLAGGTPVLEKEMALADLLRCLKCTTRGRQAALYFCLVGEKKEGGSQAYTALFCNGKRLGDDGTAGSDGSLLRQESSDPETDFQDALEQVSPDPEADIQDALEQVSPDSVADFQDALEQVSPDPEADIQDALEQVSPDPEADLDVETTSLYVLVDLDEERLSLDSESDLVLEDVMKDDSGDEADVDVETLSLHLPPHPYLDEERLSLDSNDGLEEADLDSESDLEEVSLGYEADLEDISLDSEDDQDTGPAPYQSGCVLRQRRSVGACRLEQHTPTLASPGGGGRARGRGRVVELLAAIPEWEMWCWQILGVLLIYCEYNGWLE